MSWIFLGILTVAVFNLYREVRRLTAVVAGMSTAPTNPVSIDTRIAHDAANRAVDIHVQRYHGGSR